MTKIMLVEDDKSLREIYGIRLLAEGYEITSAGDGEEALALAVKEHPDLIISDVMMPKISGFDMLDILRATPETKNIKIIMMTALSSEDQRTRGEALGANRYLVKSQVGIEDVIKTVHDVLGDKTTAPADVFDQTIAPTTVETKPEIPTPLYTPIQSDQVIAQNNSPEPQPTPEATVTPPAPMQPVEAPSTPTAPINPVTQPVEPEISPATTDMPPVEYNTNPIPPIQNDIAAQISQELSQPAQGPAPQPAAPQFSSNDNQDIA